MRLSRYEELSRSAEVDMNTLRDLLHSSYPTKTEFINLLYYSFKIITD